MCFLEYNLKPQPVMGGAAGSGLWELRVQTRLILVRLELAPGGVGVAEPDRLQPPM